MRDLDFGRQLIRYLEELRWPEGVVVEDLSYAATLVLHRLQELEPAKLVLVGAVERGVDRPGAVRRYALDVRPPAPEEVHRSLEESVQGVVDLDHTLAVARHWGGLPPETVVIEVEAADCSFGLGFSEVLAAAFDPILELVREELSCEEAPALLGALDHAGAVSAHQVPVPPVEPSRDLTDLARFAHEHRQLRLVQAHRPAPSLDQVAGGRGVAVAGRSQPWGVGIDNGGDWYDVIPLDGGWLGLVIGDAPGRGVEAAAAMTDLRAAVRAYAVLDPADPGRVLGHLDRFVHATGVGKDATVVYAALRPSTGEVRLANAGHCRPLLLPPDGAGDGVFVLDGRSAPLGAGSGDDRPQAAVGMAPGSSLLLFTDGLVQSRTRALDEGLERLRRAASEASRRPEALCDYVLHACTEGLRRNDDICVLAARLA
jgi:hydrogenase maturation protease